MSKLKTPTREELEDVTADYMTQLIVDFRNASPEEQEHHIVTVEMQRVAGIMTIRALIKHFETIPGEFAPGNIQESIDLLSKFEEANNDGTCLLTTPDDE